jgi:hypothetical protein
MKTRILELATIFVLIFFTLNSCKEKEDASENETIPLVNSVIRYDVKGFFSLEQDELTVLIPVTDNTIKIADEPPINISTAKLNVLLIRVDDENSNECTKLTPVTGYLKETYSLKGLGFKKEHFSTHKKIKIIVINNDGTDYSTLAQNYKDCLSKETDYLKDSCLNFNTYCAEAEDLENENIRPNEDGGDIIVGG